MKEKITLLSTNPMNMNGSFKRAVRGADDSAQWQQWVGGGCSLWEFGTNNHGLRSAGKTGLKGSL